MDIIPQWYLNWIPDFSSPQHPSLCMVVLAKSQKSKPGPAGSMDRRGLRLHPHPTPGDFKSHPQVSEPKHPLRCIDLDSTADCEMHRIRGHVDHCTRAVLDLQRGGSPELVHCFLFLGAFVISFTQQKEKVHQWEGRACQGRIPIWDQAGRMSQARKQLLVLLKFQPQFHPIDSQIYTSSHSNRSCFPTVIQFVILPPLHVPLSLCLLCTFPVSKTCYFYFLCISILGLSQIYSSLLVPQKKIGGTPRGTPRPITAVTDL